MTMRIGHTLFGGAVAGLVIASGVALCAASASGHNEVTRYVESNAQAVATASGYVHRVAGNYPTHINATAHAQGVAVVEFKPLPVEITGTASAGGKATAEFFVYSFGVSYAYMDGAPVRRVRLHPRHAFAAAYAEGDSQTWQLGYTKKAVGRAHGFGTTYHVGRSSGFATASISSSPSLDIGAAGSALSISSAEASALFAIGGAGYLFASAEACPDASVTREGVLEHSANSRATASALATVQTVNIQQSQTGRAVAAIIAYPKVEVGGKGYALAKSACEADGLAMSTGASAVAAKTAATAVGNPHYQANAISVAVAKFTGTAYGLIVHTGHYPKAASCAAKAEAFFVRTAQAKSSALANSRASLYSPVRNVSVSSTGVASADCYTGYIQYLLNPVAAKSKAVGFGNASSDLYELGYAAFPANAYSTGAASARAYKATHTGGVGYSAAAIFERSVRFRSFNAHANAYALAVGYNQVNDLQRAPDRRTHYVKPAARIAISRSEPRLIITA